MKLIQCLAIMLCSFKMSGQLSLKTFEKNFFGCWTFEDRLHDERSYYTPERIKAYSNMRMCFAKDTLRMYEDTMINVNYSFYKMDSRTYLRSVLDADKLYFNLDSDSLIAISIEGLLIGTRFGRNRGHARIELFFDGRYLYVFRDETTFRYYKSAKAVRTY